MLCCRAGVHISHIECEMHHLDLVIYGSRLQHVDSQFFPSWWIHWFKVCLRALLCVLFSLLCLCPAAHHSQILNMLKMLCLYLELQLQLEPHLQLELNLGH